MDNNVKTWQEILQDNKEKMALLLYELKRNYILYNTYPAIVEYEQNYHKIKSKIQNLINETNTIIEKNGQYIATINKKIQSFDQNKVHAIPFLQDNATKILKTDTNTQYNTLLIRNIEMGFSILILSILFYNGTK